MDAAETPLVLLVSGSLRDGSVNGAVLRTAAALAPATVRTESYAGLADLPPFSPDDDREGATPHPAVAALREQLDRADAILFCTPEYAGSLPGSFKNMLDWSVGGGETYGMPVAFVNASGPAAPTGGAGAHAALRAVLGYTGTTIVEAACRRLPLTRDQVGADGLITDPAARAEIVAAVDALARAADPSAEPTAADGESDALIVVDVQQGFDDPAWGTRNNPQALDNILTLIARWRERGEPIVFVRHDSTEPGSPLAPGQPGNALREELGSGPDLLVVKNVNSAFYGTPDLHAWLTGREIGAVTICGITTNHCCETTARMAGNLGYATTFAIDATYTFDRLGPDGTVVSADALARATAASLNGEFAAVIPTAEIVSDTAAR